MKCYEITLALKSHTSVEAVSLKVVVSCTADVVSGERGWSGTDFASLVPTTFT